MHSNEERDEALRRMRACGRRGADCESAELADALAPSLRDDPSIALERARARMRQGDMKRARAALEEADRSLATPGQQLVLILEDASLLIVESSAIRPACEAAQAAISVAHGQVIDEADWAEAQRVYARIQLSAAVLYELDTGAAEKVLNALPGIADVLERAGRLDESLAARLTHAERIAETTASVEALNALVTRAQSLHQPQVAGEALLRLSERLSKTGAPTEQIHQALDQSSLNYQAAQHFCGDIAVRHARAILAIDREFASPEILLPVRDEYLKLRCQRNALTVLMDLAQVEHKRGNMAAAGAYRRETLELAEAMGMGMLRDNFRLGQADLLMRNNQYSEAIDLCLSALSQKLPAFMDASYRQLLAAAYSFVENYDEALPQAEQAIAGFEGVGAMDSASVVVAKMANDLASLHRDEASDKAEALLITWISRDQKRGDISSAIQKYELLAQNSINQFLYSPTRRGRQELLTSAELWVAAGERMAEQLPVYQAAQRKGDLYQLRGQLDQARGDPDGPEKRWREALETFEQAGLQMEAANSHYIIGVIRLNRANERLQPNFGESERNLNAALDFYEASGMRSQAADTHQMLAQLYTNASIRAPEQLRNALCDAALGHLTRGESHYDAIRREYNTGSVLEAQRGKRTLIEKSQRIHDLAMQLITSHYGDSQLAWNWTQRAKARALSDTLGTGSRPPGTILTELQRYPESLEKVTHERELATRLNTAPAQERLILQQQLTDWHAHMGEDPHLASYLALRLGSPLSSEDLRALLASYDAAGHSYVCVDWVSVGQRLWLIALPMNGTPQMQPVPLTVDEVRNFVTHSLGEESFRATLRDNVELLRELDSLIAPLTSLTSAEDLLILSPTGPLHAIPMHALHLEDKPLLVRNPVVYCPSLGTLRQCLARVETKGLRSAALLGDPSGDRPFAASMVEEVASWFGTEAIRGEAVRREAFLDSVATRDLVHFQGHAKHDRSDPLASELVFADGSLTAREVFDIPRMHAELLTLAACESAANVIATGDEPLGLIPALLYAGANTVVATLWRVHQESAALTMRGFYAELMRTDANISKVDALRKAMLAVRETDGFETEYHWAPFVLNGDWQSGGTCGRRASDRRIAGPRS